jgi:hypothetical protein
VKNGFKDSGMKSNQGGIIVIVQVIDDNNLNETGDSANEKKKKHS